MKTTHATEDEWDMANHMHYNSKEEALEFKDNHYFVIINNRIYGAGPYKINAMDKDDAKSECKRMLNMKRMSCVVYTFDEFMDYLKEEYSYSSKDLNYWTNMHIIAKPQNIWRHN